MDPSEQTPAGFAPVAGAARCAVCQCPVEAGEPTVACPGCGAPYHAECWQENGGCGVYGCAHVPPTSGRTALEIPAAYWGSEQKPCPSCGQEILAAALRCRHCGSTFQSPESLSQEEYARQVTLARDLPGLQKKVVRWFAAAVFPLTMPVAALYGWFWYPPHRVQVQALPSIHRALATLAWWIGLGGTGLLVFLGLLYALFGP